VKTHSVVHRLIAGLAAAELPMVLLIAPALLFPTDARILLALLVPLTWVCHWYLGGRLIPATPLNASILVLLIMTGVSLFATFDIAFSLGKISGLLLSVLLFWVTSRWVITSHRLKMGTVVFLFMGAGLAIVGLLGTKWIDKFPAFAFVVARLPRVIRGVADDKEGFQPNAVAACLLLFIPLQVALLRAPFHTELLPAARRNAGKWMLAIQTFLLILTAGTLVLTQSRSAWMALFVSAIALLGWNSRRTRAWAALSAGAAVVLTATFGPTRVFNVVINQSGPGMAGDVSGRMELWSTAIRAIQDFPLTGMGMNTFRKVMPVLYPMVLTSADVDVPHAHNHLLQAALDLGVPGLIAYLSIWLLAAALLVDVYRRGKKPIYRVMASGYGAGLLAFFVFNMPNAIPLGSRAGVPFWLTLALVVSLHHVALMDQPDH
jgi:putative inorganic carbon (hco3(-)) transporter